MGEPVEIQTGRPQFTNTSRMEVPVQTPEHANVHTLTKHSAGVTSTRVKRSVAEPASTAGRAPSRSCGAPLVIAVAAPPEQLDGVLVVISSTLAHASNPRAVKFRIITYLEGSGEFLAQIQARLRQRATTAANDAKV